MTGASLGDGGMSPGKSGRRGIVPMTPPGTPGPTPTAKDARGLGGLRLRVTTLSPMVLWVASKENPNPNRPNKCIEIIHWLQHLETS